jgi:hypothetical protein
MKRFYIILLLLLFYFFAYSQQVPNGDFELWTGNTPDQWDTSNESVMGTNFSTVTKESVAFSGSYAAKVKNDTKYIFPVGNVTMPGILTLGDFVLDIVNQTGNIVGGKPFPYRPYSLKGYYKSTPLGGNTPMIGIGLSKWNYQTNTRDTIGFSVMYFPNTVNNWTEFEIIINWTSNEVPDSMNIIIAAADLVSGETFATNSAIFVDNLYFEYPQSQEIISVGDFNPIYVSYGTLFSQLPLPEQAWVTLDDSSNELLNVVWNQGPYPSNGDIPGEYILEGDLELVSGILNPNNLKAYITVTILEEQVKNIISVGDYNPIYVDYGTLFNQLPLPQQAWVTLDDNSNELLNVVWNQGPYPSNGDIPGEYILEGDLELVSGILNPNNLKAYITVTILDPVIVSIQSNQQINVYPVPVNDVLYIESGNVLKFELFNISGQKVFESVCLNNKIDLSGFTSGTYIMKLYSGNKVFIQKIIKQ